MANILNIIEKRAFKTYRAHEFVKEYGFFISLVLLVKLATSLFSAYAGFYYVNNLFLEVLNNVNQALFFSVLSLVLIEFLTNISLSKFYKTSLRGNIKSAIGFMLLSFIFFGLSFYISTLGLAQRQSTKNDNSAIIIDKFNLQLSELKKEAETAKIEIKQAIETIKSNPEGWRSGKRDVLQPDQLKQINDYYAKIEIINKELRNDIEKLNDKKLNDLKANSGNITNIEKKFYRVVTLIMLVQLAVNGLIMFFYSKIYQEKYKEDLAKETVREFASDIGETTDKLIKHNISNSYLNYLSALTFQLDENDKKRAIPAIKKEKTKIGFKNQDLVNNDSVNNETLSDDNKLDSIALFSNQKKAIAQCKNCNKEFKPYNIVQVFCSKECRLTWHKKNNGFELEKFLKRKH
ncbi:MAG: hypothetical protein U0W24_07180 [Bacteroidales bacterium]